MKPKIPLAIKHGHEYLVADLKKVIQQGGKVKEKAEELDEYMNYHFSKEEEYALPPLGLLLVLTEGKWDLDPQEAIKMSDTLQEKFEEMSKEHENIAKLMHELKDIAEKEHNSVAKQFVKNLTLHVELEDQVLYPATLLIGNYLKNVRGKG